MKYVILIAIIAMAACGKDSGFNGSKAIDGIRNTIAGKWKAVYQVNHVSGEAIFYPAGHQVQFNLTPADSAFYIINDTITARAAVDWQASDAIIPGRVVVLMTSPGVLPKVGVEGVFNDSLYLFEPVANGTQFIFVR